MRKIIIKEMLSRPKVKECEPDNINEGLTKEMDFWQREDQVKCVMIVCVKSFVLILIHREYFWEIWCFRVWQIGFWKVRIKTNIEWVRSLLIMTPKSWSSRTLYFPSTLCKLSSILLTSSTYTLTGGSLYTPVSPKTFRYCLNPNYQWPSGKVVKHN